MLTNNKKNFVRSIAMLLVLLMVVAVGLTACNKGAITEEVDPTVDEKLAAALESYIKADDKATVAAIIKEVLGEEGISAEKVETLTNALESYITADDAKALITDEVAKLAMEDAMTKQDVLDILKDYYKKAEVDAKLESYFGEFEPAQVKAMMDDMDKAMNKKDWNKATDLVLATIDGMQKLLTAVTTEIYTQANMAKVNEAVTILGITPFVKASTAADALLVRPTSTAAMEKDLEYRILRAADVEEINALKAAVDAALAVPTFKSELTALENKLYALGEDVAVGGYTGTNDAWVSEKWAGDTNTYHNKSFAKNSDRVVQVVTLNDLAGFYQWQRDYDDLYVRYLNDSTLLADKDNTLAPVLANATVYNVFKQVAYDGTVTIATSTAATMDGYTKVGQSLANASTSLAYLKAKYGVADLAEGTIMTPDKATFLDYSDDANLQTKTTDWKNTGKYGYEGNETLITDYNLSQDSAWSNKIKGAYAAVYRQLQACNTAVYAADEANNTFKNFLLNTVFENTPALKNDVRFLNLTADQKLATLTDAELLNALTTAMCEAGLVDYNNLYLTTVTTEYDQAIALNGKTSVGLYRYELYEAMISKAYDLLWDKYKVKANQTAATMLKDYISLVYEAKTNDASANGKVGATTPLTAQNAATLAAAMTAGGENTAEADLTAGFVDAYLNGTANGKLAGTFYEKLGKNFNATNLLAYYANNGEAKKITTVVGAGMTYATYQANPLYSLKANAFDVAQRLTGSMLSVSLKIDGANKDQMKASGVAVQDAFDTILAEGIANLDEIIARFIIEDYKAKTYNDMTVKIDAIVGFYGANANVVAAMQQYLMGVNDANAFGGNIAYSDTNNTKVKSWTFGKNTLEDTLTNAQLLTNVTAITVNPYATSNGVETVKVAAEAQKAIDAAAANATAVIENVAIKANFLGYLEAARMNWLNIYRGYTALIAPEKFELLLRMSMLSSEVDDTITVIKYYAEQDGIELKDYKANYVEILAMIGAQSNNHLALLAGKSIEETMANAATLAAGVYTESLKAVKSTYALETTSTTVETFVTNPVKPATIAYVGTAVVDLDKLVNADVQIKTTTTATGAFTLRNLY